MSGPNRFPIVPDCPKCGNDQKGQVVILDLSVEHTGKLIVTIFCGPCDRPFNLIYSIPRLLYEAEMENNRLSQAPAQTPATNSKPTIH